MTISFAAVLLRTLFPLEYSMLLKLILLEFNGRTSLMSLQGKVEFSFLIINFMYLSISSFNFGFHDTQFEFEHIMNIMLIPFDLYLGIDYLFYLSLF
jgi:hypothetical protein